jgi:protein required for attachment to host cells
VPHDIPQNTLIVVADGHKATLFRNDGVGEAIVLREVRRLAPENLNDDGPSGMRPVEQTRQQTDEATFAKQLAKALYAMRQSNEFESLVLVADPQTLGQLRDAMHKIVSRSVLRAIPKDFTNHTTAEITEMLREPV